MSATFIKYSTNLLNILNLPKLMSSIKSSKEDPWFMSGQLSRQTPRRKDMFLTILNAQRLRASLRWFFISALVGSTLSFAQSSSPYPSKPIRLVVPFTPGGVTDTSGRLIAEFLSRRLGQQVVVDNKPGASGNIGTQQVAAAEPDGYTLLLAFDGTMVINPHLFERIPFNTLRDFSSVGKIGDAVLILVANPNSSIKTVKDVIEVSKQTPQGLAFGTSGNGGTPHIAGELLKQRTGANLVHVPYKGGGQALTDVLGGNIPLVYTAIAGAVQYVKTNKLTPIAVSSAQRSKSLPEVPTFIESGISDFEINAWVGILAPSKTPKAITDKLNADLNYVLNEPEVKERLATLGITPTPQSADKFSEQIKRDFDRYSSIIKSAGIKLE
jgi:tripartite-type tricarboxylate transporter receptor subunit TctC